MTMRQRAQPWTEAELAILNELYPTTRTKEIAARLGRNDQSVYNKAFQLKLSKAKDYMSASHGGHLRELVKSGAAKLFPNTHKFLSYPIGSERITRDGFIQRKVSDAGNESQKWRPVHHLIWEEHNGPVPKMHIILFKDGNKRNTVIENLVCISKAEAIASRSTANLPKELAEIISLRGQIVRAINQRRRKS
jgi:hypothetical protein